jgi:hypothetical protein
MIGRSRDTLRRWRISEEFVPSFKMDAGELEVWLYSDDDIERLRKFAATKKPGRPPKNRAAQ